MLDVCRLGVSFGSRDVFHDVTFHLEETDCMALVGPNGCGKTTLLAVLAGSLEATQGEIRWRSHPRVAWLSQVGEDDSPESGGEGMRRRLSGVFRQHAGLVLLDEPTNHLDGEGRTVLLSEVKRHQGAMVIASHDRDFIDDVATKVLAFDGGRARLFEGGYSRYREVLEAERRALMAHQETWRREGERLRELALRQRQWAERAHAMAGERNPSGKRRAAKAMKKALASEGRLRRHNADRPPRPAEEVHLQAALANPGKAPPFVVRMSDLTFTYRGSSSPALKSVDLAVKRGERCRVDGANGAGKSTLISLVAAAAGVGDLPAGHCEGTLEVTPAARVVAHRQGRPVDPERSALEQARAAGARDEATARTLLAVFGLAGEAALRPAMSLSPGEGVRLAFALDILAEPDLLLLDEPTNHLDVTGREALGDALCGFAGAVIFTSHDRAFARKVATRTLMLDSGRLLAERAPAPRRADDEDRLLRQVRLAALEGELVGAVGEERERLLDEIRRLGTS